MKKTSPLPSTKSSTKSHRHGVPPRGRSSRIADTTAHQPPLSPTQAARPRRSTEVEPSEISGDEETTLSPSPAAGAGGVAADAGKIEDLRKQVEEALAKKQSTPRASATVSPQTVLAHPFTSDKPSLRQAMIERNAAFGGDSISGAPLSNDSATTIKGAFEPTPGTVRTPSYPFPRMDSARMNLKLQRGTSHISGPSHKPFTLLSPTNAPYNWTTESPGPADDSSDVSVPAPQSSQDARCEDPNFPAPDLYDLILTLNAEPGLELWWGNVTQILVDVYGAERVSLAVPGDTTDLENVPWGQKATFNIFKTDSAGSSNFESSESEIGTLNRKFEGSRTVIGPVSQPKRPALESRHSIAGVHPDLALKGSRQRPTGPVRAISNLSGYETDISSTGKRPLRQTLKEQLSFVSEGSTVELPQGSSESASQTLRAVVHRSLQALESEPDPLLIRTGVASLFGKRKPVVLTRSYSDNTSALNVRATNDKVKDKSKAAASDSLAGRKVIDREGGREKKSIEARQGSKSSQTYEEYEQPEPSPWSQSPAPSPAARPDPTESPFFSQPVNIDETAFDQDPPNYDYASTANQPLAAIGTDSSKTLVHIPLIQPVPSRGVLSSNLKFPVAIISILSSITPYPKSFRQSLSHLLPHLASSYSLAQQYSNLQDRIYGSSGGHRGPGFGLGGTFSDESSELELVAELSGHAAHELGGISARASLRSTSDQSGASRGSPPVSASGTPFLDQVGFSPSMPSTPGRTGMEMVDSYFLAKRQKTGSAHQVIAPSIRAWSSDSPEKSRTLKGISTVSTQVPAKKVTNLPRRQQEQPVPSSPRRPSGPTESESGESISSDMAEKTEQRVHRQQVSFGSQIGRGSLERPLPESIATLMLNFLHLQLFLAKPQTGELVWTNSKFDAFRTQGEGRVKDPWQNVHSSDREGVLKGWSSALKTGNQFTYNVRVKRFNNDNDYRWFIFRASTLLSQSGRLLYWIGSFMDIHEQYVAELKAAEEKESLVRDAKYRALANSIPQILFEAVEEEGIVSANEQWHAFSGQSLEDALGLGFAKHVHVDDLQKCGIILPYSSAKRSVTQQSSDNSTPGSSESSDKTIQPIVPVDTGALLARQGSYPDILANLVEKGVIKIEHDENGRISYSTELRLRSLRGEFRWFLVRLVKVESDLFNGGRASWYGTCTDINVRKALEREIGRVNKKIQQEMESKTKFFANMSHEIRTPLNGILGSIPWLVESSLDNDQRRTLDTIQNSSNNLRELVDNILDVTKVEAGKMKLVHKWFHVRTLLEEIIDTVASRAIDRGLELNYTVDLNVPANVKGDPFRLRQILINLVGNAVKFTEQGEVYTRCSIREQPGNPTEPNLALLDFEVVDTGRGFSKEEFERLFKQFGQIEGSSSHDAGSGLGLFLSKQLVEMHGGRMTATSQAGQGATFSFFIKVESNPSGTDLDVPPLSKPSTKRSSTYEMGNLPTRESGTPTVRRVKGMAPSPDPFKYVASPEALSPSVMSPAPASSGSSDPSLRSVSGYPADGSSISSSLPTPESVVAAHITPTPSDRQILTEKALASKSSSSNMLRSRSSRDSSFSSLGPEAFHPTTYSIVVICPAQHARTAIKQHIEQVVPHQVAVNVTTLEDVADFLRLMGGPTVPVFTHIVLDLPASADVMLFMRRLSSFGGSVRPTLVIITDHYQKRDILEDYNATIQGGVKAFLVHKPVKPSVFALIFDPAQVRNLSKDRSRDMAQSVTEDFKNVSERVKKTIGGKSFRILLVEDSDVNRLVILRYLKKVDLVSDTATNGVECMDKVLSKPAGFYSLIICDIQMPKKNGYETCREIREWEARHGYAPMPIMALTANAMPEERVAAAQAGFSNYLTKPVEFNTLGTMMISMLDARNPHVYLRDRSDRVGG